jgi:hypothetical protein
MRFTSLLLVQLSVPTLIARMLVVVSEPIFLFSMGKLLKRAEWEWLDS